MRKLSSFFLDLTPERIAAADSEGVRGKMASVTQLASVLSVYEVSELHHSCLPTCLPACLPIDCSSTFVALPL